MLAQILETYTKTQIADLTGVRWPTVNRWFKVGNIPTEFLPCLGFEIKPNKQQIKEIKEGMK